MTVHMDMLAFQEANVTTNTNQHTVTGIVRGLSKRTISKRYENHTDVTEIWTFRVEQSARPDTSSSLQAIEFRGEILGHVNDGDEVKVSGELFNGTIFTNSIRNQTTKSWVVIRSSSNDWDLPDNFRGWVHLFAGIVAFLGLFWGGCTVVMGFGSWVIQGEISQYILDGASDVLPRLGGVTLVAYLIFRLTKQK